MSPERYARETTINLFIKGKFPLTLSEIEFQDLIERVFKDGVDFGKLETSNE